MVIPQGERWSNWSGSVQCTPDQVISPSTVDELARLVGLYGRSGRHIRVVGAGHSFTPLVQTDDILISLEHLQGLESIDHEAKTVTVLGGTQLKMLGDLLFKQGLAQENLGDIDVQSIAGAISTGTHGTGIQFGTLSTQVVGLTLVTARGDILECSPDQNPDIFKAAQVSLGMLGVIAKVKLRVVQARRMQYQGQRQSLATCLDNLEQYRQDNAHFEFYWFPYTEWVQTKCINETTAPVSKGNIWSTFNKIVLENGVYWLISEACRLIPQFCQRACHISARSIANVSEINYSHRLFTTPRLVRFQEMEYNIPVEHMQAVVQEIQACIKREQFAVHFPIECRFVQADDIWLSPAYQRTSAYIAVHMYKGMPYRAYFSAIEEIFKRYQGRPHWGKLHLRTAAELAELYPRWHDFQRIRATLDPQGIFLNSYLRVLFDVEMPALESSIREEIV